MPPAEALRAGVEAANRVGELEPGPLSPSPQDSSANCGGRPPLVATGVAPLGIISIGIVPMGVVAIGVVPMGVISLGAVSMGLVSAAVVNMGVLTAGVTTMGVWWAGLEGHGLVRLNPPATPPVSLPVDPARTPAQHHHQNTP